MNTKAEQSYEEAREKLLRHLAVTIGEFTEPDAVDLIANAVKLGCMIEGGSSTETDDRWEGTEQALRNAVSRARRGLLVPGLGVRREKNRYEFVVDGDQLENVLEHVRQGGVAALQEVLSYCVRAVLQMVRELPVSGDKEKP